MIIAGANVHSTKLLAAAIEVMVAERPEPTEESPQNLCLDKAYDSTSGNQVVPAYGYLKVTSAGLVRRSWMSKVRGGIPPKVVVERTSGWLSKWRAILVRYDK